MMSAFVALLAIIVVPVLLYYTGIASSLAAGTALVGVMAIFSQLSYLVRQDFPGPAAKSDRGVTPTVVVLFVVALIIAHGAVAWTYQPFDGLHFFSSLLPLALLMLGGCCVGELLRNTPDSSVDRAIRRCFLFFCLCALGSVLGLSPPGARPSPKPVFPFNEPSHLGIIFTPFLVFCCIRARGFARYAIWFAGIVVAAALQNLTLVASCGVAAFVVVRGVAFIPAALMALGVGTVVDLGYYASRIDLLSEDNTNLSALIYIQGWQLMGESLGRSGGWGAGFQQLGLFGTDVPAAQLIYSQTGEAGNLLDGSFTFAKLVGEVGVFGMLLTFAFLRLWWRCMRKLRRVANGVPESSARVFAMCVIAGYIVELFVRGGGYFTSSGMLLAGALWIMAARDRDVREEDWLGSPAGGGI
jgi:hypothetical protein